MVVVRFQFLGVCEYLLSSISSWNNSGNFQILSCVGLGLGIWILVDKSSFVDLLEQVDVCYESKTENTSFPSLKTDHSIHIYNSTAILILIVAVGSILISFFGCCGAFKESRCMIGTVSPAFILFLKIQLNISPLSISSSCLL